HRNISCNLCTMPEFILSDSPDPFSKKIDYSTELNQEQLEVVLNGDGSCLVLAGAGSGKTRTVTYRVAHLIEQGIDPSSILLLTFTNKAAREMLDRVFRLVGEKKRVWGGTFHSVANRMLRVSAKAAGYTNDFTIMDQEDSRTLIKVLMKELKIDPKARRFPSASVVQNIISFSRNTTQTIDQTLELKHPNFQPLSGDIEELGRMYKERKNKANSMDFDDLLINWLKLIEHPELGPIISNRFKYILVDEYQDTNALQARIISGLGQAHKNVLVVGDDAQSIYAFRGADVKNILGFPKQWPDVKVFKLQTNYRSVPDILDLANDSLANNVDQFEKELVGIKPRGQKPLIVPTSSARQEAQFIAEQILALRSKGVALANMAVLFRSSAHSQALEFEMVKRDIPYEYRGGMKFFGRAHIKDVLSHLRVIQNPQDETAWLRVLSLQTGIGAVTASRLVHEITVAPDIAAIIQSDISGMLSVRAKEGWDSLSSVLKNAINKDPADTVRSILDSQYRDYLEREYPDYRDRLEDLEQLALFAEGYKELEALLADISLYDEVVASQDKGAQYEEERMVLSTIHQAKGLEWDTVFVMHLADSSFPNKYAVGDGEVEEERRLFYVACTRAKNRLYLTYPLTMGYDTLVFNRPSMFLDELSPHLTERMEIREARSSSARKSSFGSNNDWSFDGGFSDENETITLDRYGEKRFKNEERKKPSSGGSSTVWKSK
ncbi:ATP-dependent helicase, partial [Patescibacteria group bacterium]|nr:ATP-dependent helicase [Patescibacteria group bacterium]